MCVCMYGTGAGVEDVEEEEVGRAVVTEKEEEEEKEVGREVVKEEEEEEKEAGELEAEEE